jgi:hypothetical protein
LEEKQMWLTLLLRALQLAPVIVAGIEHIHGEKSGATKKQMAMDALALASGSAGVLAPEQQPAIDAATQLTSNVIDGVVSVYNASGVFKGGGAIAAKPALVPAAPAPAPAPAVDQIDQTKRD